MSTTTISLPRPFIFVKGWLASTLMWAKLSPCYMGKSTRMGKSSVAQNSCGRSAERSHFLDTFGLRRHKHPPQVGARRLAFLRGGLGQGEMDAGFLEFRMLSGRWAP